ncbi:PadR family transcriptional regulator [Actinomadura sp. HBU206391]|uniref:PadR family transcriptional regulator n=1 Tax=Actinomadura sp. HBU206391 TaxID=2731692 RepID=UPI0016504FFB|nr:PadR family transcriptional regulator [Actinomadura sp. HBU206391]MBC6459274.1 helix-turn-helix transcriptional regulator [Actinomadura sp. HBU206391]
MSPVFGHGRLRLYLLKLLEESPRHGYEVIRLLQDRFLGIYSPSPGTIYPRLARLESEGLVTHEVVKGKKVYQLTDKGRAELERRMDELADLEEEISASAQEFARGVQQDVRQTVRSLREELTQAAREMRDQGRTTAWQAWRDSTERQKEEWRRQKGHWREQGQALKDEWRQNWENAWRSVRTADTATGDPQLEFEQALRRFVEDARQEAWGAHADEETLAAARALLEETTERLRTEIFRRRIDEG